jgi:hypothetical protein
MSLYSTENAARRWCLCKHKGLTPSAQPCESCSDWWSDSAIPGVYVCLGCLRVHRCGYHDGSRHVKCDEAITTDKHGVGTCPKSGLMLSYAWDVAWKEYVKKLHDRCHNIPQCDFSHVCNSSCKWERSEHAKGIYICKKSSRIHECGYHPGTKNIRCTQVLLPAGKSKGKCPLTRMNICLNHRIAWAYYIKHNPAYIIDKGHRCTVNCQLWVCPHDPNIFICKASSKIHECGKNKITGELYCDLPCGFKSMNECTMVCTLTGCELGDSTFQTEYGTGVDDYNRGRDTVSQNLWTLTKNDNHNNKLSNIEGKIRNFIDSVMVHEYNCIFSERCFHLYIKLQRTFVNKVKNSDLYSFILAILTLSKSGIITTENCTLIPKNEWINITLTSTIDKFMVIKDKDLNKKKTDIKLSLQENSMQKTVNPYLILDLSDYIDKKVICKLNELSLCNVTESVYIKLSRVVFEECMKRKVIVHRDTIRDRTLFTAALLYICQTTGVKLGKDYIIPHRKWDTIYSSNGNLESLKSRILVIKKICTLIYTSKIENIFSPLFKNGRV